MNSHATPRNSHIDGNGERVIINAIRSNLEAQPSQVTGIAERTIEMSIFGLPIDNSIVPDPSTVTGVAERIIELEEGIGIPTYIQTATGTGPILVAEPNARAGYPAYGDLYPDSSIGVGSGVSFVDENTGNILYNQGDRGPRGNREYVFKPFDPDSYGFWWLTTGVDSNGRITWQAVQDSDNWILRREAQRYGLDPINDVAPVALFLQDSGEAQAYSQRLNGNHHLWMGAIMEQLGHGNTRIRNGNREGIANFLLGPPGSDRANKYLDSIGSTSFGAGNTENRGYYSALYEMGYVNVGHGDSVEWTNPYLSIDSSMRQWDPAYQTTREQFEARYARGERRITLGARNSYDSDFMSAYYGSSYQMYTGPDGQLHPGPDDDNPGLAYPIPTYGIPAPAVRSLYGNDSQYEPAGWEAPAYGLNPDYDSSRHATDPSEVDGLAERVITGSGVLVVDDPSVVVGVAEREVETNEITQELKPIENNIVVGVAERIIVLEEGIRSTDDYLEEQSKVTAIVYTNNVEQSKIHTKRKFVLRKERTKQFIVRQTPTG